MRKIIYALTVSLDGFVESADGKLDWGAPSPELHQYFNDRESVIDLHLYGRRLYELMAASWPQVEDDPSAPGYAVEYSRIWKKKPKVVISTTLQQVGWNSRLVRGNVLEEVTRLKAEGSNYISVGGPGLASSLMQLGLVDEYWLYLRPIILGGGKRMFPPLEQPVPLRLLETRNLADEVVMMRYGN